MIVSHTHTHTLPSKFSVKRLCDFTFASSFGTLVSHQGNDKNPARLGNDSLVHTLKQTHTLEFESDCDIKALAANKREQLGKVEVREDR